METESEKLGGVHVVSLRGRLDLGAAPQLEAFLQESIAAGDRKIVLDCRELKYVSSSGLGVFIATAKRLAPDAKLAFASLSPNLQSLMDMTGIAPLFDIFSDKDAAVQQLSAGA